jgi:hypothetical protein
MKLNYVIKFVSDMTRAVSFYRDTWLAPKIRVARLD